MAGDGDIRDTLLIRELLSCARCEVTHIHARCDWSSAVIVACTCFRPPDDSSTVNVRISGIANQGDIKRLPVGELSCADRRAERMDRYVRSRPDHPCTVGDRLEDGPGAGFATLYQC